jgi:serine/threonine protein phosphatase 1
MPEEHKEFLKNLPWCVEHPEFLFVHSGIDPIEPYELQVSAMKDRDFSKYKPKWLYDENLAFYSPKNTDKTIVSGHTILQRPLKGKQRILIDTGAGYGGKLTALFLPEYQIAQV